MDREEIFEKLVQNAQRGDIYRIKFRGESTNYIGIPIMEVSLSPDDETFTFKVLEPKNKAGVFDRAIGDIEEMEIQL